MSKGFRWKVLRQDAASIHPRGRLKEIRTPNSEIRKKIEARNPNAESRTSRNRAGLIRSSDFGLLSRFGLRFSDLSRIRFRSWLAGGGSMRQPCRVNGENFSDAALVVLGHGTAQNDDSAAPVYQHAAELRRRKIFAEVREAFWKQEPQIKKVLAEISAPRVFIVPLFISEGYFSERSHPARTRLCPTTSTTANTQHSDIVLLPARRLARQHDRRDSGPRPGNRRNSFRFRARPSRRTSRCSLPATARRKMKTRARPSNGRSELIRALNLYAGVHAIFLEESPRIAECYQLAQTKNLVVVPFFISDGLHTQEDIPVLLGEAKRAVRATAGRRPADVAQSDGKKRQAGLVFARHRQRTAPGGRDFGTGAGGL